MYLQKNHIMYPGVKLSVPDFDEAAAAIAAGAIFSTKSSKS